MKYNWVQVNAGDNFLARDSGIALEFHGWIWVSDGYRVGGTNTKDMLRSANGYDFIVQRGAGGVDPTNVPYAAYAPICAHEFSDVGLRLMVVDENAIKVSEDGTNWSSKFTGPKPYRAEAKLFSHCGKLILLRAEDIQTSEDDGENWEQYVAPWQPRASYSAAVFDGKIYVVSGSYEVNTWPREVGYPNKTSLNDVWCSEDGLNWECIAPKAAFRARMWPGLIEHDGHLYMTGGWDNFRAVNYDDTWRSRDGKNWERLTTPATFTARHAPTMFSRNGRLLMVAGNTNNGASVQNDIWELREA